MTKALLKVLFVSGLLSVTGCTSMAQVQTSVCPLAEKSVRLFWATSFAGCPFSAVIETERTQTLADGTHVQTRNLCSAIKVEAHRQTTEAPKNGRHFGDRNANQMGHSGRRGRQ